jgi:hypothetical protein
MTIRRLLIVSITALVLHLGSFPGTMALGQRPPQTSEAGAPSQVAAAPLPPALEANDNTLPDAPGVAWQQNGQSTPAPPVSKDGAPAGQVPNGGKQTKRILYIIPNFRAVSADEKLPPQTIKDKFVTGTLDSFDYSAFIFVAIQAGIAQAHNATPEFRQGAAGYGRYYWHAYADYVDENLWVEFLLPTALHQDSRYYTLGRGGFAKRLGYSLSRAVITRKDSGHETFNASEILGAGAAAGISSLYYPSQERTFSKTYQLWLTSIAIDAGSNLFKEFWPDINHKVFHQKE